MIAAFLLAAVVVAAHAANTTIYVTFGAYGSSGMRTITGDPSTNTWTAVHLNKSVPFPRALAVFEDYLYVVDYTDVFTGEHALYRMSKADASGATLFIDNVFAIGGLAIDPYLRVLFWSESPYQGGCGCVRAADLDTGANVRTVFKPSNSSQYWKGTQIALDPANSIMYTSWHVMRYTATSTVLLYMETPNTVDGGITMADADIGAAIDPIARNWYGVLHNYGDIAGNMVSRSYALEHGPETVVYHVDYSDIGTLAVDPVSHRLFFMTDSGQIHHTALNGTDVHTIPISFPLQDPDDFLIWLAFETEKSAAQCAAPCTSNWDCAGGPDNTCTRCSSGQCSKPGLCNATCAVDSDCSFTEGCPNCLSGVCRPQPYCGMPCKAASDCSTVDGCPLCIPDEHGENRCLAYPPSSFVPGVYIRTECTNSSGSYRSGCTVVAYNLSNSIASRAPLALDPVLAGYATAGDPATSRYFVLAPVNTSLANNSWTLMTYSYKRLNVTLVNECVVNFGVMTLDTVVSVNNLALFDPASNRVIAFGGPNCYACGTSLTYPIDPATCAIDRADMFNVSQHVPQRVYWTATPIAPGSERFYSLSYSSDRPLCSFAGTSMTAKKTDIGWFPTNMNMCGDYYYFQYQPNGTLLYVLSAPLYSHAGMYTFNVSQVEGGMLAAVAIWPNLPTPFDNNQFYLSTQPSKEWDSTGFKLIYFIKGGTPWVYTTNNTLVFRGRSLPVPDDGTGIFDDSFAWVA
eukprot:m.65117 g.65117  ORF g.65117 m.65117 type:complete len:742 (-) comp7307_c0_seq1:205-2430(-)